MFLEFYKSAKSALSNTCTASPTRNVLSIKAYQPKYADEKGGPATWVNHPRKRLCCEKNVDDDEIFQDGKSAD